MDYIVDFLGIQLSCRILRRCNMMWNKLMQTLSILVVNPISFLYLSKYVIYYQLNDYKI
nr:MAG TPA: hypothetical protein [Caudoviricetes sp.]